MSKYYEIVIYTASLSLYANPLINKMDPNNYSKHRLFREHCTSIGETFVKDLSKLGRNLKDLILVDNSPLCYSLQPENGLPILTWINNKKDDEFAKLAPLLKFLSKVDDVRNYLPRIPKNPIDYIKPLHVFQAEFNCINKKIKDDEGKHDRKSSVQLKSIKHSESNTPIKANSSHYKNTNIAANEPRINTLGLNRPHRDLSIKVPETLSMNFNMSHGSNRKGKLQTDNRMNNLSLTPTASVIQNVKSHITRPSSVKHKESIKINTTFKNSRREAEKVNHKTVSKPVLMGSIMNSIKKVHKNSNSTKPNQKINDKPENENERQEYFRFSKKPIEHNKLEAGRSTNDFDGINRIPITSYSPGELMQFQMFQRNYSKDKKERKNSNNKHNKEKIGRAHV